ncbi:MAG: TraB/GumN family protein [Chlorobi bacterium CHB2]|nr:TraB/GumN family protein [Chlorobi bacterium CHB2]
MRFYHSSLLLAGLLFVSSVAISQPGNRAADTKESNNTLLWRISGNGVRQHSYLFGTYHTRDPRAFQFTDSMVAAFNHCTAFFGELHLDSAVRDFYQHYWSETLLDIAALFTSATSGTHRLAARDSTWEMTLFSKEAELAANAYPVFLDAWLFRHAELQGKRVGGLEDLATQLKELIPDSIAAWRRIDLAEESASGGKSRKNHRGLAIRFLRYMQEGQIAFYQDQDLESIEQTFNWAREAHGRKAMEVMLDDRSLGMANRIDSLVQIAPSFVAVGCAHLLGDKGIVATLRKKGYTVTPVHSQKSGATIAHDTARLVRADWRAYPVFHQSATVELPLEPVELPPAARSSGGWGGRLAIASDAGTGVNYFLAQLTLPPHRIITDWPALMRASLAGFADSSTQITITQVQPDTAAGPNPLTVAATSNRLRARLMMRDGQLYLLLAITDTNLVQKGDAERFFRSFRFAPTPASRWEPLAFDTGRCHLQFPSNRQIFLTSSDESNPPQQGAVAVENGTTFTITAEQVPSYQYFQSDSARMVSKIFAIRSLNRASFPTITADSATLASGFLQLRFAMQAGEGGMRGSILRKGTFEYLLTANNPSAMPSQASVDSFLASFQLLPPAPIQWESFSSEVLGFSMDFPGEPEIAEQTDKARRYGSPNDEATAVTFHDMRNGSKYTVEVLLLNQYARFLSMDTLFRSEVQGFYSKDSIFSSMEIASSNGNVREYIYGQPRNVVATRYRLVQQGRHVFLISYFGGKHQLHDSAVDRFFASFQAHPSSTEQWEIAADKVPQFFGDLLEEEYSGPASTLAERSDVTELLRMGPHHTPIIYSTIDSLLAAGWASEAEEAVAANIITWLEEVNDTATTQFLRERYSDFPSAPLREAVLNTLIGIGSRQSLQALSELLQQYQPDGNRLRWLARAGINSGTTGVMYPGILSLAELEPYQESLYWLTTRALDSNLIAPATLAPHRTLLLRNFRNHLAEFVRLNNTQLGENSNAGDEAELNEARWNVRWKLLNLANCLGRLPAVADVDSLLRECAAVSDPQIAAAAAIALLQHGVEVDTGVLQRYATPLENRAWLYRWMLGSGVAEHFPAEFKNPTSFATSNLAEWFEAEDGVPAIIELIGEQSIRWKGVESVGYLFRFTWDSTAATASWGRGLVVANAATQPDTNPTILTDYDALEGLSVDEQFRYFMALMEE